MNAFAMFRKILLLCGIGIFAIVITGYATAQANPHEVPVVDGEAGSCTADLTVTNEKGDPVYGAKVRVHIAYGFMGMRKTDLEVGTNVDGKARFIGLPDNLNKNLYFRASKDGSKGAAFDNPTKHCHAQHSIVLHKP